MNKQKWTETSLDSLLDLLAHKEAAVRQPWNFSQMKM